MARRNQSSGKWERSGKALTVVGSGSGFGFGPAVAPAGPVAGPVTR